MGEPTWATPAERRAQRYRSPTSITTESWDGIDVSDIAAAIGSRAGDPGFDPRLDIDGNGIVDGIDLSYVAAGFLEVCE